LGGKNVFEQEKQTFCKNTQNLLFLFFKYNIFPVLYMLLLEKEERIAVEKKSQLPLKVSHIFPANAFSLNSPLFLSKTRSKSARSGKAAC